MSQIKNKIKDKIQNNRAHTLLIIVPNEASRQKRERELIEYHPNSVVIDLQVQQINYFIQRLFSQTRQSRTHISSGIQRLWLQEIANANNTGNNKYQTFRPNQNIGIPDSTLSLIVETINNLRERDDTKLNFIEDNQTQSDLEAIYGNYNKKLGPQWIDEKGKNLFLADNFHVEYFKSAFPKVDLIVVENFTVLSKANIKLLKQIAKIDDIDMWFCTDWLKGNENLYQNITNLVKEFEEVGVNIDSGYERETELQQHFAENLFQTDNAATEKVDLTDKILLLEPTDRSEEVEQIAHAIQTLVLNGECKLSDICVTYYNITKYQQPITETFSDYGIRYSLSEKIPLTKSEVVKSIFSYLTSNQNTNGYTYFSDKQNALEKTQFHPLEFQDSVNNIINKSDTLNRILNPLWQEKIEIVEGEINALQSFTEILQELCSVLNSEDGKTFPIDVLVWKLHYIAKHTSYQSRASKKHNAVKILPLGELRSSEFHTVFIGDFVDGGFPVPYRKDPLLPETPYRTENEHLHDNRFLFYRGLKSFREKLYLLSPKRDRETELIPSIFRGQLEEIAKIGTEEFINHGQKSRTGYLSSYGDYMWKRDNQIEVEFPDNLKDMKDRIDHVVSVEKGRENINDKSHHAGYLSTEELTIESHEYLRKLKNQIYSVTELETYANCPFQYYVRNVLRPKLKDEEEEDEISRLEKGDLAHTILFQFYTQRKDNQSPPISQCSQDEFEEAKRQLDSIIENQTNQKRNSRKISEDNLLWSISTDKLRTSLFRWLAAERLYDLTMFPNFFEERFGSSPSDSIQIKGVNMQGRIDRIDIGDGYFNVIDYKTGSSTVRKADILNGRSLQLPIYLQIAAVLLENAGITGYKSASGLYHKVRLDECNVELGLGKQSLNDIAYKTYKSNNWKKASSSGQLLEDEMYNALLERVNGYVKLYVDNISEGIFPLITRVDNYVNSEDEGELPLKPKNLTYPCSYCSYNRICRVDPFEEEYQKES